MSKALRAALFLFFGLLLFATAAVLTVGALSGGAAGTTLATGRSINVRSTAWTLRLSATRDTATIDSGGHRIVVAPAFVRVDGNRPSPINAAAKSIAVHVTRAKIAVAADGRTKTVWTR
jgi:hypothetical protein